MSAPKIPPRNPIGDDFEGAIVQIDAALLLSPHPLENTTIIHTGSWVVRYGVAYLGKPHVSIVPSLLALDYGEFLTGENAWHFLMNKSNLHPRADVVGFRNDGEEDMVVVKSLDLMQPLHILIYADNEATKPLAQINAIITTDTAKLPERLNQYATIYHSLEAWQEAQS
ncbi:MAG: hypothetical protein Q9P01_11390 [Anaerolineae bacterium]|nr:hypothetical protein [Anaerolineae bacterium]MDQ7035408.1 hypothetical protein [Anaerolineae bacterium]